LEPVLARKWFVILASVLISFSSYRQKEIEELRNKLGNISSTSDAGAQKLKEEYLQKLNVLESQVGFATL